MHACGTPYIYYAHYKQEPFDQWVTLDKELQTLWKSEFVKRKGLVNNKLHAKYLTWINKNHKQVKANANLWFGDNGPKKVKIKMNYNNLRYINRNNV